MNEALQGRVANWVSSMFGYPTLMDRRERACRVLEEAIELAQAEGVEFGMIDLLATHVYEKPKGDPNQEAAGVGFTLTAWAAAAGVDLLGLVKAELLASDTPERRTVILHKTAGKNAKGLTIAKGKV